MTSRFPRLRAMALACAIGCALPAAAPAQESAGEMLLYRIKLGDTLIGIGQKLLRKPGDWIQIQKLNDVREPRRLPPDGILRIPMALLRTEPLPTEVVRSVGEAQSEQKPIAGGESLPPRAEVRTGEDGFVTVRLADGSLLVLQPRSRARFESQSIAGMNARRTAVSLLEGRVEVRAAPAGPGDQHEVRTPAATVSVRGTRYRVGTDAGGAATRAEVTEGTVALAPQTGETRPLESGFGAVVQAGQAPAAPVALLSPPDLAQVPELHERTTLRIRLGAPPGGTAFRVQIARDGEFAEPVTERLVREPEMKLAAPPDGDYFLRARAVDKLGLEGLDATRRITIFARPEPPFASEPPPDANVVEGAQPPRFAWTASEGAARYRLQIAGDAAFGAIVHEAAETAATALEGPPGLAPGKYHWRVASTSASGRKGPWGDPQRFNVRRAPPTPAPPQVAEDAMSFSWPAEPNQRFEFQLARDGGFADVIATRELGEPTIRLERPAPGTYFMRVRAIEPDGYVGPYSATQRVELPEPPRQPWWLFLLLLIPLL